MSQRIGGYTICYCSSVASSTKVLQWRVRRGETKNIQREIKHVQLDPAEHRKCNRAGVRPHGTKKAESTSTVEFSPLFCLLRCGWPIDLARTASTFTPNTSLVPLHSTQMVFNHDQNCQLHQTRVVMRSSCGLVFMK